MIRLDKHRTWLERSFLSVVWLLLLVGVAAAHSPVFVRDTSETGVRMVHTINDPERSWAIYGRLTPGNTGDVITINAQKGQRLWLQILVPQRPQLASFYPRGVLVGPGLPGPLPRGLPPELRAEGAVVVPQTATPEAIYEGFTQMNLWVRGSLSGTFPATGQYRLLIFDPDRKGGPYIVAVGEREVFGLLDVLTFPLVWVRSHIWLWK